MKSSTGAGVPHSSSRFEGFCMDILYSLQEIVGFDYKVYLKTEFGKRLKNGSWTGLIGELTNGVKIFSVQRKKSSIKFVAETYKNELKDPV